MQQATQQFSQDAKVTISALQVGGDVAKFTGLFPDTVEGRASFVSCTLGDFSKCQAVIEAALKYATDLKGGFPAQLSNKATPNYLVYHTAPYSAHGIYPKVATELTELIERYRLDIHKRFESELQTASLINSLLAVDSTPEMKQRIIGEQNKNNNNLLSLAQAGNVCYNDISKCAEAHNQLALEEIDKNALELPPPPTASFRVMNSVGDIYSRSQSIAFFNRVDGEFNSWLSDNKDKTLSIPVGYVSEIGMNQGKEYDLYHSVFLKIGEFSAKATTKRFGLSLQPFDYYRDQFMITAFGPASGILYIQGTKLSTALLYFQGNLLDSIVLDTDQRRGDNRYTEQAAALIVETSRVNDNWWDINIDKQVVNMTKSKKAGDGVFYIRVRDGFGRERRFDIAYVQWRVIEYPVLMDQEYPKSVDTYIRKRHRWWDQNSSGIGVNEGVPWSTDAWALAAHTLISNP